ncbi:M24 family metallopeptidase [Nonomuraea africana]|uniref:Xaa-Pro dipeptidase n=1 Tax=Nonomuraea africana TaxID=46171 RepID=A0ABR9KC09_9ACTN|nr:M24 family metallopeptidase [Nonomuraea africana]MBE1559539.1 Xaa-Pro dipeptidase [Nonomuraea africana]
MREQLVRQAMAAAGVDALVLRPSPDFRFLGGAGDAFLVVVRDRPPIETSDPAALVPRGARRVGVDDEMRVAELFAMRIDAELIPASAVLRPLRLRKSPGEVEAVARAAGAADAVLTAARELAWFGATEREMAARLRALMVEGGCEELLSVRVAAGEHTAARAHAPTERVINPGDALQVSVCGRWDGFCAEVARVFAVAEPPEDFEAMYSVVLAARAAALEAVRPGAPAAQVAGRALQVIEDSGYGDFAQVNGRGVGWGPDEGPRLDEPEPLADGMTLCVAPAIQLSGLFGARVADTVACGRDGALLLTPGSPALHVLDR